MVAGVSVRSLWGSTSVREPTKQTNRGLLGVGHHRLDLVQLARKPRGQTVRQQAEGGVALTTVPASDLRPARDLARVGAVACERTSPARVIRATLQPCSAPRLGLNVLLAGKPRLVAKLHRPWPGGRLPARANSSLVARGAESTATPLRRQAVTMWTRPTDRAPSYGACGQALEKLTLPHRLPTLGALAPTSSPLRQQRFMGKATPPAPAGSRIAPSSQAIRLRNTPTNTRGDPTRQSAKQHSMNSKTAMRASAWDSNVRRSMSSHSSVAKKLSAMALSKQSPADPVDVTTLISRHRLPNASEVYWVPLSE